LESALLFLFRVFSVDTADMLFFTTIPMIIFLPDIQLNYLLTDIHARYFLI